MFNAYATSLMCREGFEILDVHPLTASWSKGKGDGKPIDVLHFKPIITKTYEDLLAEYLMGNVPEELSLENYQLS